MANFREVLGFSMLLIIVAMYTFIQVNRRRGKKDLQKVTILQKRFVK